MKNDDSFDSLIYSLYFGQIDMAAIKNITGIVVSKKEDRIDVVKPDSPEIKQLERDNLQRLIDKALETGDRDSFLKYTEQLKAMVD